MLVADWAAAFCSAAAAVHLATVTVALCRCRLRHRGVPAAGSALTVIRPVCGLEPFIAETLRSTFALDHPEYEILLCVARHDDPAIPLVLDLIDEHPERPARLLVGDEGLGPNPKLNNILKGWKAARHDWIVIADSNALLPADALRRLQRRWDGKTGAVCSMPIGARPGNLWAEVECAFLNTLQARFQYVSEAVGLGFAQGKTMLLRRDLLECGGGIGLLAMETAEDAATTKMVRSLGRRVRLVDAAFEQPLGRRGFGAVWARQVRWARLRRVSFPLLFLPEILVGSALPTIALAIAAAHYGFNAVAALTAFLTLWFGAELTLARALGWRCSARLIPALLLRDWLLPVLWVMACAGSRFVWHGNAIQAQRRDHLEAELGLPVQAEQHV